MPFYSCRQREESLSQNNTQLRDDLDGFTRETADVKNQMTQLQDVILVLNSKMDGYQARNRELENEVESIKQSALEKENEMFTRITALSNDLDTIQAENLDLVAKEQESGLRVAKGEEEVQTMLEEVGKLREEIQVGNKKVGGPFADF